MTCSNNFKQMVAKKNLFQSKFIQGVTSLYFFKSSMQTRKELYSTLGYTPGKEWYYPNMTTKKNE